MNTGSLNRPKPGTQTIVGNISKDDARKWMWWFLVAIVAAQFYYVHELLGAWLVFAMVFAVIVAIVAAAYLIQRAWVASVAAVQTTVGPLASFSRRGLAFAEELGRKALRIGSQHVQ